MPDEAIDSISNLIFYAGGLISFGLSTMLLLLIGYLKGLLGVMDSPNLSFIQAFVVFLLSGGVVGYIVSRRAKGDYVRVGIKSGLFSALVNLMMMFLNDNFTGGLWVVCGSILGGCMGGILFRYFDEKLQAIT